MTHTRLYAVVVAGTLLGLTPWNHGRAEDAPDVTVRGAGPTATAVSEDKEGVEERALAELGPIWLQEYLVLSRYGQDLEQARAVGQKLLMHGAPEVIHLLAWEIAVDESLVHRDLALASALAERAKELTGGVNVDVLDTCARVLYARGEVEAALAQQREALALCTDSLLREMLLEHLREMEGAPEHRTPEHLAREEFSSDGSLPALVRSYIELLVAGVGAEVRTPLENQILQHPQPQASVFSELAWFLMTTEIVHPDPQLALRLAEIANRQSQGQDADVLDTYALALFVNGDVAGAIARQEEGLKLCRDPELERLMALRLEFYRYFGESGTAPRQEPQEKPRRAMFV